jgi:hypothetical protein
MRLPGPKERCFYTGLSRTALYELVQRSGGRIKSVLLKKPGRLRGIRLIHLQSLQNYLSRLAETQAGAEQQHPTPRIQTTGLEEEQEVTICEN